MRIFRWTGLSPRISSILTDVDSPGPVIRIEGMGRSFSLPMWMASVLLDGDASTWVVWAVTPLPSLRGMDMVLVVLLEIRFSRRSVRAVRQASWALRVWMRAVSSE